MKELFRFEKVNVGESLHNYSVTVFESDIFCIQSTQEDSLRTLTEILCGRAVPETGQFYEHTMSERGIFVVSSVDIYPEKLSVTDYFGSIKPMFSYLSHKKERQKLAQFFRKEGMVLDPDTRIWELDSLKRYKLQLLKAKMTGAKLVIFRNDRTMVAGKMAEELKTIITDMNEKGITFLILSDSFSPLFELASRIQYLWHGRALKEWEQIPPSAQQRLIYGDKLSDVKSVGTNAKLLLGIYNYEWDLGENIWSYLNRIREANPAIWERTFAVEIPNEGCGYADGVAVIPRNSQELLLENLNIGENISILARQRVCYGKSDIVDRHLQRKLAEDICRKYGFPKPSHSLKELNEIQRKLLSIVRFEVLHPTVIFLETPYQGIRPEEADTIRKCMYGLAEKHIKIVYFSQSLENMARDCREIWQVYENKVQNLTPFE